MALSSVAAVTLAIALVWCVTNVESTDSASIIAGARLSHTVTVHARGRGYPHVNLADGRDVLTSFTGPARLIAALQRKEAKPLALASSDFDEDGAPDLICGYGHSSSGIITLLRGNVDSIYGNSLEAQQRKAAGEFTDAPFLSPGRVFALSVEPEFLGCGDFDGDGYWDVVATSRRSDALFLMRGNGTGAFGQASSISLPGRVTAFVTGEINRRDGLDDVVVAISGRDGPKALVFEGPEGALNAKPEVFDLPAVGGGLGLGRTDDDSLVDLAIAAGHELIVIQGRDRKLSLDEQDRTGVSPPNIDRNRLDFNIRSIAVGDFGGDDRTDIAVLSDDGALHIVSDTREAGGTRTRILEGPSYSILPATGILYHARVSGLPGDNLLLVDSATRRLHLVSGARPKPASTIAGDTITPVDTQGGTVSLDVEGEPAAVLPMRLNSDARDSLVVLSSDRAGPSVLLPQAAMTLSVNNTNDAGPDSLRQALLDANSNPGTDTIVFKIPGAGVHTIAPASPFPVVTDPVIIDGTTQPGFAGAPLIELDGTGATAPAGLAGLQIRAGGTTVRGLVINRFPHDGIVLETGENCVIEGNFIGTDANGARAVGNGLSGVAVVGAASTGARNNLIGGTTSSARNIISGNRNHGVVLNSPGNLVQGNFIGTDVNGAIEIGNLGSGVASFAGSNNEIGGTTQGTRNIISGNRTSGVLLESAVANLVQGNFIGTGASGSSRVSNGAYGVLLIRFDTGNTIGGTVVGARNIISGNLQVGVALLFACENNLVQGNFIGTRADGASDLGNRNGGYNSSGSGNILGGSIAPAGNVISGNDEAGVAIFGNGTTNNHLQNNLIGTDVTGTFAIGNSFEGILVSGAGNMSITDNIIASSGRQGILIGAFTIDPATGVESKGGQGVIVEHNFIGTDRAGSGNLGNTQDGIFVENFSLSHMITENTIAFNRGNGVKIPNQASAGGVIAPAVQILVSRNSMYSNGALGIDLAEGGPTENDDLDPDFGANFVQNFPVLTSGTTDLSGTTVLGTFNSEPSQKYTLEFFSNSDAATSTLEVSAAAGCVPQGKTFIGSITVTTDNNGNATIHFITPVPTSGGFINATATNSSHNTSELSACLQPKFNSADLSVTESAITTVAPGGALSYQVTVVNNGPDLATNVVLTSATPEQTTFESLAATAGWTTSLPGAGQTGAIVSTNSSLQPGTVATFTLAVRVSPDAPDGLILTHSVSVSSGIADLSPGNNSVTTTTIVRRAAPPPPPSVAADLELDLKGSPASVFPGDDITYTLSVTNLGPAIARDVVLRQSIPMNATFRSSTGVSGWTFEGPVPGNAGDLTYRNPTFASGESLSFVIVVRVNSDTPAEASIISAASASSAADPNPANNFSTRTTTARARPPGPNIQSIEVSARITIVGSGFLKPVEVFIDGVGFSSPAKVKRGVRVIQKGRLADGRSIAEAVPSRKVVKIKFRNSDGGETEVSFRN